MLGRRYGSQNTGMAERVKPRSREAVRHFPEGFTRDDSPGEDECGVLWAAGHVKKEIAPARGLNTAGAGDHG
jgi:hypothetical protein